MLYMQKRRMYKQIKRWFSQRADFNLEQLNMQRAKKLL